MAEKTYLTPIAREPEFIVSPMGLRNELGVKIKRRVIKFRPNARKVGQFTTSDPKVQEWLENCEWFKLGKMEVLVGHLAPVEGEEPTQTTGPQTSEVKVKRGRKAK